MRRISRTPNIVELDWGGITGFIRAASPTAHLTIGGLLLTNLPPGHPTTFPMGFITMLGWLLEVDGGRLARWGCLPACLVHNTLSSTSRTSTPALCGPSHIGCPSD